MLKRCALGELFVVLILPGKRGPIHCVVRQASLSTRPDGAFLSRLCSRLRRRRFDAVLEGTSCSEDTPADPYFPHTLRRVAAAWPLRHRATLFTNFPDYRV